MQDDNEKLIKKVEAILADWERDGGETYRDLADRIVKIVAQDFVGLDDLPQQSDHEID